MSSLLKSLKETTKALVFKHTKFAAPSYRYNIEPIQLAYLINEIEKFTNSKAHIIDKKNKYTIEESKYIIVNYEYFNSSNFNKTKAKFNKLNIGKDYLTKEQCNNIKFNVVMCVSDEIIDWSKSSVTIEETTEKFLGLKPLTSWASPGIFETTTTINGCTSMRRLSGYSDSNYYLWLDTDIIFDPLTLAHSVNSIEIIEGVGITKFVAIPEIVRQWDSTWDCLVNERFINKPIGYQSTNNPHVDAIIYDEPTLEEVRNNVPGQPNMKFGGGCFALISIEFRKVITFVPVLARLSTV
jgi:hypothetical protein